MSELYDKVKATLDRNHELVVENTELMDKIIHHLDVQKRILRHTNRAMKFMVSNGEASEEFRAYIRALQFVVKLMSY